MKYSWRRTLLGLGLSIVAACESESGEDSRDTDAALDLDSGDVGSSLGDATAMAEPAPVPCSVDAESDKLSGARIHIEADDCSFRSGEGGKFRYRVELPSSIDYSVAASTSCGLCAQDRTEPSALVVARVGAGSTHYCPSCDVGCCPPDRAAQWTLQAKSYEAVLDWPGRAWNGPSDTLMPLGAVFLPGRYDVDVTLQVPGVGTLTALLPIEVK